MIVRILAQEFEIESIEKYTKNEDLWNLVMWYEHPSIKEDDVKKYLDEHNLNAGKGLSIKEALKAFVVNENGHTENEMQQISLFEEVEEEEQPTEIEAIKTAYIELYKPLESICDILHIFRFKALI